MTLFDQALTALRQGNRPGKNVAAELIPLRRPGPFRRAHPQIEPFGYRPGNSIELLVVSHVLACDPHDFEPHADKRRMPRPITRPAIKLAMVLPTVVFDNKLGIGPEHSIGDSEPSMQ